MEISKEQSFGYVTDCGDIYYDNFFTKEKGWFDKKGLPCERPDKGAKIAYKIRLDRKIKSSIEMTKDTVFKLVVLPNTVFVSVRNYKEIVETYYFACWCKELVLKDRHGDHIDISCCDLRDYDESISFINKYANKASNTADAIKCIEKMRLVDDKASSASFYALFKELPITKCDIVKVDVKFRVQGYYGGQSDDCWVDGYSDITVDGYAFENGSKFIAFEHSGEILTEGWSDAKRCKRQSAVGCVFVMVKDDLRVDFVCSIANEKIVCENAEQAISEGMEKVKKYTRISEEHFIY